MFKKIASVALAATMMCGTAALCANAAETSAETTGEEAQVVYFDVAKSGWEGVTTVYCHIWAADGTGTTNTGGSWTQWQTKKERCSYDGETGIATYKLSKVDNTFSTDDGRIYCVIFSADSGQQTFDTIMSGSCIGDTAYCEGGLVENPQDSQKVCYLAKWTKEENADCGAIKTITSVGNVVGTGLAEGVTDADLFASYMISYYDDETKMAGVQAIINNEALSFTKEEVDASLEAKLDGTENKDAVLAAIDTVLDTCTFPEPTEDTTATEPTTEVVEPTTEVVEPTTENVNPTVEPTLWGDANGDNKIDVSDVTAVQKYIANIDTTICLTVCDVDRSGLIDISDATTIQKYLAKIITSFPAEG